MANETQHTTRFMCNLKLINTMQTVSRNQFGICLDPICPEVHRRPTLNALLDKAVVTPTWRAILFSQQRKLFNPKGARTMIPRSKINVWC
jgi:hypothetical protein